MDYMIIKQPRVYPHRAVYNTIKRVVDVATCVLLLPVVIPIMLICALAIYLDSPGPIFFIQERIGKGGRPFKMYKFRTMNNGLDDRQARIYMKAYVRAEVGGRQAGNKTYKPSNGHNIFWVGKILRKTSLDELPQLINVIKGEMSIVGPRPNVIWEVEAYYPWHYERMEILPGITGLAQVRGRSCIDFATLVRGDIEYIENQSILLDIKILWWTFLLALTGKGAE